MTLAMTRHRQLRSLGSLAGRVARAPFSRRRAVHGLGALVGAAALPGCGDSSGGTETDIGTGDASTTAGEESTGANTGTGTTGADTGIDTGTGTGDDAFEVCDVGDATPAELLAGIDHIVVVMMENRSFDHYFGSMSLLEGLPVAGLLGDERNATIGGEQIDVFNLDHFVSMEDPPHGWDASRTQWNSGANDGFVRAFQQKGASELREVMGYYARAQLPVFYALADEYVLCDRWFASVMGPTWPNRFFLHLASSDGNKSNEAILSELPSIFSRCMDKGVSAKYYASNLPFPIVYGANGADPFMATAADFFDDAAVGDLPAFSMVEPTLTAVQVIGDDDHAPADVQDGQGFLATVYKTLAASPNWARTLLVITYDEHGGFFDHVSPPMVEDERPEFKQLGFRVPSVVVGAQVRRGCANGIVLEHASVAATVTRRFGLEPLNLRAAMANDLSSCIDPALINAPRPPISLPQPRVRADRPIIIPGANFGGQVELARAYERTGKYAHREWRRRSVAAIEAARDHGRRLGALKFVR
jgi:phospholipase C